ncbi:meiosis-specific protein ASY3-like [Salvia divinorum]|uniref:Meiosis-specific protein ASY3-like n=1 Tax=Salvia divinorum TaxID=28513 RepID=A0ABD1GLC4_SALDI
MGTDVGRQTDLQEEPMSDRQSLSSNYRYCSQSRKMSIGVLVDSISNAKTKTLRNQGPELLKLEVAAKKIVCFNPKKSSSVADQDTGCTPSLPATRRTHPTSKLLEKPFAASLNFFAAKSGLGSDVCRQKNSCRANCSVEEWNVHNAEHVENPVCSPEQGVRQEKEQVQNNDRTTETGGRESLRIKLWEILGDVSSPTKQLPSLQCEVLHPDQERNKKQCPTEELTLSSDTIESDSQVHVSTRPMTHSLARRRTTRKQGNKSEATKSNDRKDCQRNRIFSSKGDISVGSYGNLMDGSLPCKGEKFMGMSSRAETNTDQRDVQQPMVVEAPKKNLQEDICNSVSKRKRNSPRLQKGIKNNTSFEIPPNAMTDQRDAQQSMDVKASKEILQEDISDFLLKRKRNSLQPKWVTKNNFSFEFPLNAMTDQRDVEQSMDVEASKKNLQEDISDSMLLKKRNTVLQSQKDSKNKNTVRQSQMCCSPKRIARIRTLCCSPRCATGTIHSDNQSTSLTDETVSESSQDESSCKESQELFPEIHISENILHNPDKSLDNGKDVGVIGSSHASDSLKDGVHDASDLEMCMEENQEDGLNRAVALFTVALGKLTNLSNSKSRKLETRYQEKQEQLLGIHKRFKAEIEQHLQECSCLIENLEEHEIELKRSMEKQRAAHKKFCHKWSKKPMSNLKMLKAESWLSKRWLGKRCFN